MIADRVIAVTGPRRRGSPRVELRTDVSSLGERRCPSGGAATTDSPPGLAGVSDRDQNLRYAAPRQRDLLRKQSRPDNARGLPRKALRTRDIYIPDLHLDTLRLNSQRNFR
jgi:hypothetical protein